MIIFRKILAIVFALHFFALISVHPAALTGSPKDTLLDTSSDSVGQTNLPSHHPFFIDSRDSAPGSWWVDHEGAKDFSPVLGAGGLSFNAGRTGDSSRPECIDFNASIPALIIKLPDGIELAEVKMPTFTLEEDTSCCPKNPLDYTITVTIAIGDESHVLKVPKSDKGFWEKIYSAKESAGNTCWRWATTTMNVKGAPINFLCIVFPGH